MKLKFTPIITTVIRNADGTVKEQQTHEGRTQILETVVREEKPKKRTRRKKDGNSNE